MKTHQLQDARAAFSRLVDDALKGEPQRVTRRGRDAVVIVSEAEWNRRVGSKGSSASFRELLLANPLTADEWRDVLTPVRNAGKLDTAQIFPDVD